MFTPLVDRDSSLPAFFQELSALGESKDHSDMFGVPSSSASKPKHRKTTHLAKHVTQGPAAAATSSVNMDLFEGSGDEDDTGGSASGLGHSGLRSSFSFHPAPSPIPWLRSHAAALGDVARASSDDEVGLAHDAAD